MLLQRIKENREKVSEAAKTLDLTMLCIIFQMPAVGFMTRWEWITFTDIHTQRHIHQLENILKKISIIELLAVIVKPNRKKAHEKDLRQTDTGRIIRTD